MPCGGGHKGLAGSFSPLQAACTAKTVLTPTVGYGRWGVMRASRGLTPYTLLKA